MRPFVLIESRDPFEDGDGHWYRRLAADLRSSGGVASLFLVENAVFAARKGANVEFLDTLKGAAVEIRADEFALRERGIGADELAPGITAAPIAYIVDQMAAGASVMWR